MVNDNRSGGRWRLVVGNTTCIGAGVCAAVASGHFRIESDRSTPLSDEVTIDPIVMDAAVSCPTESISVIDAETGARIYPT